MEIFSSNSRSWDWTPFTLNFLPAFPTSESEWPEPEINSTPLLSVVPQGLFLSLFLKGVRRGAAVFQVCPPSALAIEYLGNNQILIQDPLHYPFTIQKKSLPPPTIQMFRRVVFIKGVVVHVSAVGAFPSSQSHYFVTFSFQIYMKLQLISYPWLLGSSHWVIRVLWLTKYTLPLLSFLFSEKMWKEKNKNQCLLNVLLRLHKIQ